MKPLKNVLITGTDTDVGKTYITAELARHLREAELQIGLYKPCCSGSIVDESGKHSWHDVNVLAQASDNTTDQNRICPQRFPAPLAPPVAASLQGNSVDEKLLSEGLHYWEQHAEMTLIEGIGGLLCPLTDTFTLADWAGQHDLPVIIVAANKLGMINHTLLTCEIAQQRGLSVLGIIINNTTPCHPDEVPVRKSNPDMIQAFASVPILCEVGFEEPLGLPQTESQQCASWREFLTQ